MKKLVILTSIVMLCACLKSMAEIIPIIYYEQVFYVGDPEDRRYYFSCAASNLETGTLWIFQSNTNLATTNWMLFGNFYYTGMGYGYGPPYNSGGYALTNSDQVFVRMKQVGTNYEFYPDFDGSDLNSYNSFSRPFEYQDEAISISELGPAPMVRKFNAEQLFIPPSIDLIMPPVITNRFYH